MTKLTAADLAALAAFDTPTVCNALERLDPSTQASGYITGTFVCGFPSMKPVVGYARTATIRAAKPSGLTAVDTRKIQNDYYRHVDSGPKPSIVVIEDLDGDASGSGAFWGEVQSAIHVGLGSVGLITNGSVRDLDQWAPGFQFLAGRVGPSHAYAKPVAFGGTVNVLGMTVRDGDLIHADRHGAVVVPPEAVTEIPAAVALLTRREKVIIDAARTPGFSVARLRQAFDEQEDIH